MSFPTRGAGGASVLSSAAALFTAAVPAAAVVLVTSVAASPRPAYAQEGQMVAEVEIRGTKNTAPLAAKLAAAAAGIKEGSPFRNEAFVAARERIRGVGLYGAVFGRTENAPDGGLRVIFEVVENPTITEIQFTGNRSVSSKDLFTKAGIETKQGDVLNTETLDKDLLKIQRYYQQRGYRAFVTSDIAIDAKTGILTIPVQETVIEDIEVTGLKKTKEVVVTRELRSKEGEPLNTDLLQRDLQRIYNLGLFADVSNARFEEGTDLGRVKVVVPVQEQRTGQVGVIFGYSVRQRLTGTLELTETNFRGLGEVVNLSWTVGGIAAANQFDIGFTEPWLDKQHTSLSFNLYNRFAFRFNRVFTNSYSDGTDNDQYYEIRKGGSVTLSRPFSEFTRGYASIRTESVQANNLAIDYNQLTPDEINSIRGALVQRGNVSSLTLRSVTNTRDNELDPAAGFYISPSVEFGTGSFDYEDPRANPAYISDEETPGVPRAIVDLRKQTGAFTKVSLDTRRYFSLNGKRTLSLREPKRVIATRVLAGFATGNIGFAEQYFVGGADNLRGYSDDRFWGNNLFLASTELRIPLDKKSGSLTGVLFMDVGDAWGATDVNREDIPNFEQHKGFRPNFGYGFGVRIKTPVGPVRLDYGIGEVNRTHFSIGQAF